MIQKIPFSSAIFSKKGILVMGLIFCLGAGSSLWLGLYQKRQALAFVEQAKQAFEPKASATSQNDPKPEKAPVLPKPDSMLDALNLAVILANQKQHDQAVQSLQQALTQGHESSSNLLSAVHYNLGSNLLLAIKAQPKLPLDPGRLERAVKAFKEAMRLSCGQAQQKQKICFKSEQHALISLALWQRAEDQAEAMARQNRFKDGPTSAIQGMIQRLEKSLSLTQELSKEQIFTQDERQKLLDALGLTQRDLQSLKAVAH